MAPSIWDDPELKPAASEYMKFTDIGDSIKGTVAKLGKQTWPDGKSALLVTFSEDDAPNLTCGQVMLAQHMFALKPAVGETLEVELTGVTLKGNKTLKKFGVEVTDKDGEVRTAGEPLSGRPTADD